MYLSKDRQEKKYVMENLGIKSGKTLRRLLKKSKAKQKQTKGAV